MKAPDRSTRLQAGRFWPRITKAARTAATPSAVAVAYWGSSGHDLLPLTGGSSLVVDASRASVTAGATDPRSLRRLHDRGVKVFSLPMLHAKVFAFDDVAFVGSTNVSRNSSSALIEAALATTSAQVIADTRSFVKSLCTDLLDDAAFDWLEGIYRAPRAALPALMPRPYPRLVMQVMPSDRQGYSGHQVQPSLTAWSLFFHVDIDDPDMPTLRLRNVSTGGVIDRKVVRHRLVITLDIPEAEPGDILEMWGVGLNRYDYSIAKPTTADHARLGRDLMTTPNPYWKSGRLWFVSQLPRS